MCAPIKYCERVYTNLNVLRDSARVAVDVDGVGG